MAKKQALQVYRNAARIYTGSQIAKKGGRNLLAPDLDFIEKGSIVFDDQKIIWVGLDQDLPKKFLKEKTVDLKLKRSIMPGLIDSHAHLVFAGDRAKEFSERCAGKSYEEIAREGGGILTTVEETRLATREELFSLGLKRALIAYRHGVRTLECKSGYGLDFETEVKCLRVVQDLKKALPQMTFVSTYLGAHAIPKGQSKSEYLDEILKVHLPFIAKEDLAEFCDVFIEEGYFNYQDGERILRAAKKLGLQVKIHADEFTDQDGARLGCKLKAASVDHLLAISDVGIQSLAKSKDTVATLLPGTAFFLKKPYAPARKLLDAGAVVAVATDFNPGSCYSLNLPLMMNLSALHMGMNAAEIFSSVTYSAAKALHLSDRKGVIAPGYDSDFVVLPYVDFCEMYYRMGW